jgi:hypothetical protein
MFTAADSYCTPSTILSSHQSHSTPAATLACRGDARLLLLEATGNSLSAAIMTDNVLDPASISSSKVIDIRKYSNTQLLALVKQPEKCASRLAVQPLPLTKEALYHHTPAATYTMGGVGQDNRYYRAWGNIVKNSRPASFDVAPAPVAVQVSAGRQNATLQQHVA